MLAAARVHQAYAGAGALRAQQGRRGDLGCDGEEGASGVVGQGVEHRKVQGEESGCYAGSVVNVEGHGVGCGGLWG